VYLGSKCKLSKRLQKLALAITNFRIQFNSLHFHSSQKSIEATRNEATQRSATYHHERLAPTDAVQLDNAQVVQPHHHFGLALELRLPSVDVLAVQSLQCDGDLEAPRKASERVEIRARGWQRPNGHQDLSLLSLKRA